jgi:hypothetical protein
VANFLGPIDLVLITADQDASSLARAWRWLPRLLGSDAVVMLEERPADGRKHTWRPVPAEELQALVAAANQRRRRAA